MKIKNGNIQEQFEEKPERHSKFYVALLVCLAAVSAAGWSTYKTVKEFVTPQKSNSPRISKPKNNPPMKQSTVKNEILNENDSFEKKQAIPFEKKPEKEAAKPADAPAGKESDAGEEKVKAVWAENERPEEKPEVSYPTDSTVTKEFSGDTPVYSKTFCDWRSHEGTDFKAEKGSVVKSITSGVVADVYEDPSYGTTVVMSHDGGFTAYYSGLEKNVPVKKGAKLKNGDEIGKIGEVPCEAAEGQSHLHLAINKEGKFIDPLLILDKEN